jgi:hypothetical protein
MCKAHAVSWEHTPPYSFFPAGFKSNLIQVPSCDEHNQKNDRDVEYVRNVIVASIQANGVPHKLTMPTVFRSLDNSKGLFLSTFRDAQAVNLAGIETGSFTIDLARVKKVMVDMVKALYFHEHKRAFMGTLEAFLDGVRLNIRFE